MQLGTLDSTFNSQHAALQLYSRPDAAFSIASSFHIGKPSQPAANKQSQQWLKALQSAARQQVPLQQISEPQMQAMGRYCQHR